MRVIGHDCSMIPFDREARDGAQQVGLLAMIGEMLDRLVDQQCRLLAGALRAEQRDERRLAGAGVLADALAGRGLVARMVDQIVGDLEGEADVAGIAAQRRARLRPESAP